jgi:adenine-specific DNA-methyltransferase
VNFASEKIREINGNQVPTTAIGDIWTDIGINNLSNEGGVSLRFGKKPEKLIARIVNIASNPKDIVMDFFTGSGTTIAVCHKLSRQYIGIEQLNYNENDSLVRLSNVINGENVGLGDLLNWQGGGSFIYCELAKANQTFIDRIQNATSTEELLDVWQWMQEKSFISYKVDIKSIDNSKSEFASLSLNDQKRFLIEVMDKNMLYVPLSEIDDETYGISDEDKQLNATFYFHEVH